MSFEPPVPILPRKDWQRGFTALHSPGGRFMNRPYVIPLPERVRDKFRKKGSTLRQDHHERLVLDAHYLSFSRIRNLASSMPK
jgi:hypothetical protein